MSKRHFKVVFEVKLQYKKNYKESVAGKSHFDLKKEKQGTISHFEFTKSLLVFYPLD